MSTSGQHHALSPGRERATLLTLGAVQFTHILDFMIMMPLGESLMRVFNITPSQFTQLVACYGLAAAISGFIGGFFMDRFDRKRALLVLYAGFGLATFACGLAPTHHWLMVARLAAGAFGGLAGSMVTAMIGDIIPPARRGRAMSFVMSSFPVASVLGIPTGLLLAGKFGWHAPFFMLGACAGVNLLLGCLALPHLRTAVQDHQPARQMSEIIFNRLHLRAFALGGLLVMGGGVLIPFIAPAFIANVGINEKTQLWLLYVAGGTAAMISMPLIGWLSDHVNRLWLFIWLSVVASAVVLILVRLGPSSLGFAAFMMAAFMVPMSGRFAPAMTMVTNAVEARYRGGFMSVNAALQQATSGLANVCAGWFVTRDVVTGHLDGYPVLGYVSVTFFFIAVVCAFRLRNAAPHVAIPAKKDAPPPAHVEAEAFT